MQIGIDLVKIKELQTRISGDLGKVFTTSELEWSGDKLASVFAAKEAFFKALGRKEDWLSVWLEHNDLGKPILKSLLDIPDKHIEVSISYTEEYVVAVVIIF